MIRKKLRRDCWDLDKAFFKWLYERVQVYLEDADKVIDLEIHTFDYQGIEYTQKALLELLLDKLKLANEFNIWDAGYLELGNSIIDIWKIIWPFMWW